MTGQRFDYQAYPEGMRGGLSLYPHAGVVRGLEVSNVTLAGTGNVDLRMNISAGAARLDGQLCVLAAAITNLTFNFPGVDLAVGTRSYDIWLVPRRVVPARTTAPSSPSAGDRYIKVIDMGSYHKVDDIFIYQNSAWAKYEAVKAPPAHGHQNLPLNEILTTIDNTATANTNVSFLLAPEKAVYHKHNYPVGLNAPGEAYLRQPCNIKLATISLVSGTPTITGYGDEARIPM